MKGRGGEWLFGEMVEVMRNRGVDKLLNRGGQNNHHQLIRDPGI